MKKVVIVGIGSLIMRDDGVGIHVVQELQKIKLPENIEVQDADTNAFAVLEYMDDEDKAVIIDAYRGGMEPGTVYKLKFAPDSSNIKLSLHDIDFGLELSQSVQKAMPEVIEAVLKEARKGK